MLLLESCTVNEEEEEEEEKKSLYLIVAYPILY